MLRKMLTVSASLTLVIFSMSSPVWAETVSKTHVLNLHDAMTMAIEYSQDIKDVESQKVSLDETLRSGISKKNQITFIVEDYKDFVDKWFDDDGLYDRYKDMSASELQEAYINLSMSQARASVYMYPEKAKQVNRDISFIKYMFMFGTDEPDLTSEELYEKYEKNALLAEKQSNAGVQKTLNMIDMIEGKLESGVLQLYDTLQTLENGIKISEENLALEKTVNHDYNEMYALGQISKVALEIDTLQLKQQEAKHLKLQLQNEMAENALKALIGVNPEDRIILTEDVDVNGFLDDVPLNQEIEMAQLANTDLIGYRLDYDVIKANYDLYMEYSGRTFGQEYESLTDDLDEAEKNVRDKASEVEANVRYGYNDILAQMQAFNTSKKAKENAEESLIQTMEYYKQGMVTSTQLSGAKLQYQAAVNTLNTTERGLQSSIMKYNILLEKGILYE